MPFSIPFLILCQVSLGDLSSIVLWEKYFSPLDGLGQPSLQGYRAVSGSELKMAFYVKSGDRWQSPGDPDDAQWSGYRTIWGGVFRYAQARVHVRALTEGRKDKPSELVWADAGLVDGIATCIPGTSLPDYQPVIELMKWSDEKARLRLRYTVPVERFSPDAVMDSSPEKPGKEGDFGALIIDENGFTKVQRGVDISCGPGAMPVMAAAVGRIVLVSRAGDAKASALDPATGAVPRDYPPGRPGKGAPLDEYGNCVYVAHPDGYTIRYSHLDRIEAAIGQGVLPGTRIGMVGEAGGAPGWVHIEVRWGDPLSDKDSVPLNPWEFFGQRMEF
jgi:hypothetical protein